MAAKPTNRELLLRVKVREVLGLSTYRQTDEMIRDAVGQTLSPAPSIEEIKKAIEWNQARGFIEYEHNPDMERDEWALTDRGQAKQNSPN